MHIPMKKKILLVPALAALLALSGCGDTSSSETSSPDSTPSSSSPIETESSSSPSGETSSSPSDETSSSPSEDSEESSSTPVEDNFALGFLTPSGVVPTSTLDLNKDTAPSSTVVLSVTNNGDDAFDEEIDVVIGGVSDAITVTPTAADYTVLRTSVKNILYALTRSNAMNGHGEGAYYLTYYAWWEVALFFGGIGLIVVLAAWGFFVIWSVVKQVKREEGEAAGAGASGRKE